jgi:hypothetical protein
MDMSRDEENALLALKNAWLGVLTSAEAVRSLAQTIDALPAETATAALDLETYHRVVGGHANATMALHGLIEQLQRKVAADA